MSTDVLEQTVADLDRRVVEIENRLDERKPKGWEAIAGQAKDDDLLEEAIRLGAEWRARENAKGN